MIPHTFDAVALLVLVTVSLSAARIAGPPRLPIGPGRGEEASIGARRWEHVRGTVPAIVSDLARKAIARGQRNTHCAPAAVADWCDDIARRMRAGVSLREALGDVIPLDAPTRVATEPLRGAVIRGASTAAAVAAVQPGHGSHLTLACQALLVAARLGGSPAVAVDRTAVVLRQRAADGQERLAHAAQARMSTHVLTALPVAVLAILALTDADVRAVISSGLGMALVSVGLVLNLAGWWWMRRLVRERR